MSELQKLIRRALIKDFYKEVLSKPKLKGNKEYFTLLKNTTS